ncbi:MAG: hypothetical protein HQL64_05650 [Magnetococcales bacterium]|nr:hypothetical protein [Magnetococcales bacterium]
MKSRFVMLFSFGVILLGSVAHADPDHIMRIGQCMKNYPDLKLTPETVSNLCGCADSMMWVSQCEKDNAAAQVSPEIVKKYCACMNDQMDEDETKTITQWEKTHLLEAAQCNKEAGWNR